MKTYLVPNKTFVSEAPYSELVRIGNQFWLKDSIIAGIDYIFDKAICASAVIVEFSQPEKSAMLICPELYGGDVKIEIEI